MVASWTSLRDETDGAKVRVARAIFAVALLAAAVWLNAATLIDAYGSGPPYHGRTTHMDKWTDPLLWLIPFDVVVIAAVLALACQRSRGLC